MSAHDTAALRLVVPVEVTVRLGSPRAPGAATEGAATEGAAAEARLDRRGYETRAGYDPTFGGRKVPMPTLSAKGMRRVAHRVDVAPSSDDHLLHYTHYTAVMNRLRRLCFFTAANTTRDPALVGTTGRAGLTQTWLFDTRIREEHQVGSEEFYVPAVFDRGHIHRREDGYWGETEAEQVLGNADTFHFTNAAPQHPGFNQSQRDGEWGNLENHIADEVGAQRFNLFAGPVFAEDDPLVEGVLVPRRYWKVVVARKGQGLGAWAFLLDQSEFPFEATERFSPGRFAVYQVTLRALEALTDVRFADVVRDADVLRDAGDRERVALASKESIRGL